MRPATATFMPMDSSSSLLLSPYFACSSAAVASRRKSLGKALPLSRSSASLARRSAISLLSSCGAFLVCSVMLAHKKSKVLGLAWRWRWLQRHFQAGFNKLVDLTIQHRLGVAGFNLGTQILDAAIIQHVRPNLAAPSDIRLCVFSFLLLGITLLHLTLIELGFKLLHGLIFVLMLASTGLTGNNNTCGVVGQTHCGFCPVNVLTTGTGGTINIHPQICRVDFDFEAVIHFR